MLINTTVSCSPDYPLTREKEGAAVARGFFLTASLIWGWKNSSIRFYINSLCAI